MGSNLEIDFVFGKDRLVNRLEALELDKLLAAVAGDLYSHEQVAEMSRRILSSTFYGARGGNVEIQVGKLYWFSVGAYEEKGTSLGVSVGFSVQDLFFYNYDESAEHVMSDFSKRARKAFEFLKPWYGYAETDDGIDAVWEAYSARFKPDSHVCWLNYYSPELIAEMGRNKILSAARDTAQEFGDVTIDELADGAIMLQVGKLPGSIGNIPKTKALETALFGKPCKYDAKKV